MVKLVAAVKSARGSFNSASTNTAGSDMDALEHGLSALALAPAPAISSSLSSSSSRTNTPTNTPTSDEPLPFGSSWWDRIPLEMEHHILSLASPLTRFIHGQLRTNHLTKPVIRAIWADVVALNWAGDLTRLPDTVLTVHDFVGVTCRSLYHRLCQRFPEQADPAVNAMYDRVWNAYHVHSHARLPVNGRLLMRLQHIALRNRWLDLIDLSCPVALGWYACGFGHTDLLAYLSTPAAHGEGLAEPIDLGKYSHVVLYASGVSVHAMDTAAEDGHLTILKMMHAAGCRGCTQRAMITAAQNGHLETVMWLHENRHEGCSVDAMDLAAEHGHLDVVKWLHKNRTEGCTTYAMDWAARNGHLRVVRWLHEHRSEGCTRAAARWAAERGHGVVVEYLQSVGLV